MSVLKSLLLISLSVSTPPAQNDYFTIKVVDDQTGRGVPLVELRTVNDMKYVTDSAGLVAFHEPGLMNQSVYFGVTSHGYEFPKDGFGYRGKRLKIVPGGTAVMKIKRINIAERLYRVTGAGIYRDSLLVGEKIPISQPVLNAEVFGSDSVVNTVYRGKIYWFWGDTNRPSYPLGNFHVPGAVSELPRTGGLDPKIGVNLKYFVGKDGFAKPTAQMPGQGPTWIGGLVVVKDKNTRERMFASYVKVQAPLTIYEHGLVEFNDEKKAFQKSKQFEKDAALYLSGHPFHHTENGIEYVYFSNPFPLVRVRATAEGLQDLTQYEAFTCLQQGSTTDSPKLDRTSDGRLRFSWKRNTSALTEKIRNKLIEEKQLRPAEGLTHLQNVKTGKTVHAHGGSVYWNEFRKRWVMIVLESFGTSPLGEIWYAEGDTPLGPWVYAKKVVTHDKYSFYNPKQHPMFDKDGGRIIFFEGTYTSMFSGNSDNTPRYNYNQMMYKLDLSDLQLALPVAIYERNQQASASATIRFATRSQLSTNETPGSIAWFALDRPAKETVPVYEERSSRGTGILRVGSTESNTKREPIFHALPADIKDPPSTTVPLYEFVHSDGRQRRYSTDDSFTPPDFRKTKRPICRVWRAP